MKKKFLLMSSIEAICVMFMLLIMSIKEYLSKNIVDLSIVLVIIIIILALIWFIYTVLHKNGVDK